MRIIVDTGDYRCGNLGDVAMLQVTVSRLAALWPAASIHVLTEDPARLWEHCPSVLPLSCAARRIWCGEKDLLGSLHRYGPRFLSRALVRARKLLRDGSPALLERLLRARARLADDDAAELGIFRRLLLGTDLVVVSGAGGITDHAKSWATWVLSLLQTAIAAGKPTAIFGHGLGPLTDRDLIARAKVVLPRVNLLALREKRSGVGLADMLNVPAEKVMVTGDDAIELAFGARPDILGNALGVNLRASPSARVKIAMVEQLRPLLHSFAQHHGAPLIGLPISSNQRVAANLSDYEDVSDAAVIGELLRGYHGLPDDPSSIETPLHVIHAAGRCRLVVTGAYHAAVFALSQGVPAVCLARSHYFVDKFLGLADQFGAGCEIVSLDAADLESQLKTAMSRLWESAERTRPTLLEAARRQLLLGQIAYQRMAQIVAARALSSGETKSNAVVRTVGNTSIGAEAEIN